MKWMRAECFFTILSGIFLLSSMPRAQTQSGDFVSFKEFLESATNANLQTYSVYSGTVVRDPDAFEEMRQHINSMYRGVDVEHSFFIDSQYFDCIPIEQQPTVRHLKIKQIAQPPEPTVQGKPLSDDGPPGTAETLRSPLRLGLVDRFGNDVS